MDIVTGTVKTFLGKLIELVSNECNLQGALRDDVKNLQAELESMTAALGEISKGPPSQLTEPEQNWAKQVRELSYDIEESVDEFMVHVDARVQPRSFIDGIVSWPATIITRHHIAKKIQRIKKEVEAVSARCNRYNLSGAITEPSSSTTVDPRMFDFYEDVSRLVGMDGPMGDLIKLLSMEEASSSSLKPHLPLTVVSIVGLGGLGKTTLANAVYNKFEGKFDCRAFVSVSQKPDLNKILSSIFRKVSKNKDLNTERWDLQELINSIRESLTNKRYFIIIDDIWDEKSWDVIKCILINNNCRSRIITTTRIKNVADLCCSSGIKGNVYALNPLSDDYSKRLFNKRVFGSEDGCPSELKEASKKILAKCGGLPLAIISIASLLANKPKTKNQWDCVHKSIGCGIEKDKNMDTIREILALSYYDLPFHLKRCLLYLSIFPEDHIIDKDKLIWKWIAEDIVCEKDGKKLYELGMSYFNELINRSMIQPIIKDHSTKVDSCRVHDMVLDLITYLSIEENFVTILDGQQHTCLPNKIRRLSLQRKQDMSQATRSLSHVRSFINFQISDAQDLPPILSFKYLRVLDLCLEYDPDFCLEYNWDMNHSDFKNIGNLFHLRYLQLSANLDMTKILKNMKNLQLLQTLDLEDTGIEELPSTVAQLSNLMCLFLDYGTRLPDEIGNLKSLQQLSSPYITSAAVLAHLGKLTELKILGVEFESWDESYEQPLLQCLFNLRKLQILEMHYADDISQDFFLDSPDFLQHLQIFRLEDIVISTLPRWLSSLSNLSILSITVETPRQEDFQMLGGLPALHELHLRWEETEHIKERHINEWFIVGVEAFQYLRVFDFSSEAMGLMIVQGAMQKLQVLTLSFDVRETNDVYGGFDFGLENLSSLKHVIIRLHSDDSEDWEKGDAKLKLRIAISKNPNHPNIKVDFL